MANDGEENTHKDGDGNGGARARLMGLRPRPPEEEAGLPWLEPVEEEGGSRLFSTRVLVGIGAVFLTLFGLFLWLYFDRFAATENARTANAAPALIQAPAEPYRTAPQDPAGLAVPDQDKSVLDDRDTTIVDSDARLAPQAEQPLTPGAAGGFAADEAEEAAAKKAAQAAAILEAAEGDAPAVPAPVAGQPYSLQLGAFSTQDRAEQGWQVYRDKFPGQLATLGPQYEETAVGGKTIVRLRAAGFATRAEADATCASLKAAGQGCMVVERP